MHFQFIPKTQQKNDWSDFMIHITIIYLDHEIEEEEEELLLQYVINPGFSVKVSKDIIKRSIQIFGGMSFEDYRYLLNRQK